MIENFQRDAPLMVVFGGFYIFLATPTLSSKLLGMGFSVAGLVEGAFGGVFF